MADYPNIPIDVSAEDIENLIKNPIPDSKLELKYWENQNLFSVGYYSTLDSLLQSEYDKTKGNSKAIFRLKFTGTFPKYHILGNSEYVAISDSKSTQLILLNTETGEKYLYKKGEQTITDINVTGEFWPRKKVSADSWPALDGIIISGSSDYDMYVLTLGPDLFEDGMSYEPLIAFIDGKGNKNMLMMDMGNGSWWEYECNSNNITRVDSGAQVEGDFEYIGHTNGLTDIVSKALSYEKLYMTYFDGETINNITVPDTYLLIHRSGNTLKFTTAIPDGTVYTYDIENKTLTVENYGDFIYTGDFATLNGLKSYTFETGKVYLLTIVGSTPSDLNIPSGRYTGIYDGTTLLLNPYIPDGKTYSLNVNTWEITVNEYIIGDFEYIGYCATIDRVAEKTTDTTKLYMGNLDINPIDGISVPNGHNLIQRKNANTIKFTTAIPNGVVYTYDIANKNLTVEGSDDATNVNSSASYLYSEKRNIGAETELWKVIFPDRAELDNIYFDSKSDLNSNISKYLNYMYKVHFYSDDNNEWVTNIRDIVGSGMLIGWLRQMSSGIYLYLFSLDGDNKAGSIYKWLITYNGLKVENLSTVTEVDQTYKPENTNPQSGKAVAEALAPFDKVIRDAGIIGEKDGDVPSDLYYNVVENIYYDSYKLVIFEHNTEDESLVNLPKGKYIAVEGVAYNDGASGYLIVVNLTNGLRYRIEIYELSITSVQSLTTAGSSGIYIGAGEMPEDCNVQIDPDGEVIDMSLYATKEDVDEKIGDINAVLDDLHDYAQSLIGGAIE